MSNRNTPSAQNSDTSHGPCTVRHPFDVEALPFGAAWEDRFDLPLRRRVQRYLLWLADRSEAAAERGLTGVVARRHVAPSPPARSGFPYRYDALLFVTIACRQADIYRVMANEIGNHHSDRPDVVVAAFARREVAKEWELARAEWGHAVTAFCNYVAWALSLCREFVTDTATGVRAPVHGCSLPWGGGPAPEGGAEGPVGGGR